MVIFAIFEIGIGSGMYFQKIGIKPGMYFFRNRSVFETLMARLHPKSGQVPPGETVSHT